MLLAASRELSRGGGCNVVRHDPLPSLCMDDIAGEIIFADEAAGDYFSIIENANLRKARAGLSIYGQASHSIEATGI